MPPMINPFAGDGFALATLSAAIEKLPYVPGRIGEMALFSTEGIPGTSVLIEERDRELRLVANTSRGAPPASTPAEKRKMRAFACAHLPVEDFVKADDLLNLREFGSPDALATLESRTNDKLTVMKQSLAMTLEWMRLGALKGIILDGAGTQLFNLYTEFGVPAPAEIDFVLGTTTTDIRGKCQEVIDEVQKALGARPLDHVHAFCGSTFWRRLTGHADVKEQLRYADPTRNIEDPRRRGFVYGDIVWEPYRGSAGGVDFVAAAEARFFPVGAPGIYRTWFAPSTWLETVGQTGQPLYAKVVPTPDNSGAQLLAQSNPLPMCLVPGALRKGKSSN